MYFVEFLTAADFYCESFIFILKNMINHLQMLFKHIRRSFKPKWKLEVFANDLPADATSVFSLDSTRNKLRFDSELLSSMHIAQLSWFCVSFDFREKFFIWSFFPLFAVVFSWGKIASWNNTSKNASKVFWNTNLNDKASLEAMLTYCFKRWMWRNFYDSQRYEKMLLVV